jgi:hypothetical protein
VKLKHINHEREFDWGNTSPDYARYRAGYPESFYEVLAALVIGKPGQTILDLVEQLWQTVQKRAEAAGQYTGEPSSSTVSSRRGDSD